jgi:hypothetical protein
MIDEAELTVLATPEEGEVAAPLIHPAGASRPVVLGHGASTTMRRAALEPHMQDAADHGCKILGRSRDGGEDGFVEMACVVREWAAGSG